MARKFLKQFEGWVIGLRSDPFTYTRLKLTVIYSIVIILGIVGYIFVLNREFNRYTNLAAQEIAEPERRARFIARSERVTTRTLYGIEPEDVLSAFIVMGISYFLAGIALKPIKEAVDNQKAFLANAAHQLKTPLAIIKTEMEVYLSDKRFYLQNPELLLRRKVAVLSNLEEIDRMNHIIEDLILIARLDSHQITLQNIPYNLSDLMKKTVESLSSYAKTKKISLKFKNNQEILLVGDPEKLQQTFYNILKNSIDCSNKDGVVKISITKQQFEVKIEIADQGIGITREELPFIFDRFYRTPSAINHNIKGTGLGLAIAQWVVKKHQGEILVQSTPNKGTLFKIILPSSTQL